MNAAELLPAVRDLYSKDPEMHTLEPWHLAWVLFALGYTDVLEDEGEIAAAAEVARGGYPQWRPAA
ncbi:MAG: hypothetical protein M3N00_02285 [Actinomycetota bacterium]|nr:hypothetical protein [Actinomycetota bacterium]